MKKNDTQGAIVHLELVKQQLTTNGTSTTTMPSPAVKETTPQITVVQSNHPPKAYDQYFLENSIGMGQVQLKGDDIDGDPITAHR